MKKLIPFKKEIPFDSNIYEITSISLEHTLDKEDNTVVGEFIVSGEYLVTESSTDTLSFKHVIPFTIDIDDIYDIENASIDVDDFYYEIINNKVLSVNIEVKLDNVREVLLERKDIMNTYDINTDFTDNNVDMNISDNNIEINNIDIESNDVVISEDNILKDTKKSLFANLDSTDNYVNYKVYIIRENDNIDNILKKYNVTKDMLEDYNDLSNIKLGDKIIIPYVKG